MKYIVRQAYSIFQHTYDIYRYLTTLLHISLSYNIILLSLLFHKHNISKGITLFDIVIRE